MVHGVGVGRNRVIPHIDDFSPIPDPIPMYGEYLLNIDFLVATRHRLHAWCGSPYLGLIIGPFEVSEVIMPALDTIINGLRKGEG